jgi:hypothetical protein
MLKVYFPRLSSNRVENVKKLVTVNLRLEGTVDGQAEVLGLDGGQLGKLGVDVVQVAASDLLVELLGQNVDTDGLAATGTELDVLLAEGCILSLEEGNLGQDLVGERAGHDEGRVAGSTAKVDKTALGEEDDVLAVEAVTVNLGLDVLDGLGVGLQPGDVNLDIEVTDV